MIEVVRPCFSPACRGMSFKQRIPCDIHPDTVDCTATCAERLASARSRCLFCGEWNETTPPEGDPYKMDRFAGKEGEKETGRAGGPGGEERSRERPGDGRKKRRRGRPGRKKRKRPHPGP